MGPLALKCSDGIRCKDLAHESVHQDIKGRPSQRQTPSASSQTCLDTGEMVARLAIMIATNSALRFCKGKASWGLLLHRRVIVVGD